MNRTLVLRRVARCEFDAAADWYGRQRAALKSEFIAEIQRVFDVIVANPERFAVAHGEFREALVNRFPYAVYYRTMPRQVIVVAVVHTSRDPSVWQSRK